MANLNEVKIEGNLCKDSMVKNLPSGKKIVNNSLAFNESWKVGNDYQKKSHFFELTAFGAAADALEQFKKGDLVHIEGSLKMDSWDDKETGKKRSKVYIVVWKVEPLTTHTASKPQGTPSTPHRNEVDGFVDDELNPPF